MQHMVIYSFSILYRIEWVVTLIKQRGGTKRESFSILYRIEWVVTVDNVCFAHTSFALSVSCIGSNGL